MSKSAKAALKQAQMEEDSIFENLIKRYTRARKWDFLEDLFYAFGVVLEDREKAAKA